MNSSMGGFPAISQNNLGGFVSGNLQQLVNQSLPPTSVVNIYGGTLSAGVETAVYDGTGFFSKLNEGSTLYNFYVSWSVTPPTVSSLLKFYAGTTLLASVSLGIIASNTQYICVPTVYIKDLKITITNNSSAYTGVASTIGKVAY